MATVKTRDEEMRRTQSTHALGSGESSPPPNHIFIQLNLGWIGRPRLLSVERFGKEVAAKACQSCTSVEIPGWSLASCGSQLVLIRFLTQKAIFLENQSGNHWKPNETHQPC